MSKQIYDAIIIGTGQAGPSLAARLAASGMKTAIIEKGRFGGTCVNTGCTPTKTLVASAKAAHIARRAEDYGIKINGSITVDMKKVKERKDQLVRQSNEGLEKWMKNTENLSVFEGHARFIGPHFIQVNNQQLEAEKIFVNVGGSAFIPPGFENVNYLTNESMMAIDSVPEHLIIVGGSYIGLEFGQMYRRFGSQVTIIEMADRLITREDPDISEEVQKILELEAEFSGFQAYLRSHDDFPSLVKDLRKRFKFLGEMGCYYYLYVVGEEVPPHEEWQASLKKR